MLPNFLCFWCPELLQLSAIFLSLSSSSQEYKILWKTGLAVPKRKRCALKSLTVSPYHQFSSQALIKISDISELLRRCDVRSLMAWPLVMDRVFKSWVSFWVPIKRTPHFGVRSALASAQNFGGVRMTAGAPHLQKINLRWKFFPNLNFSSNEKPPFSKNH